MAKKTKTVTVGGRTHVVESGSKADVKYSSQPGAVSSSSSSAVKQAQADIKARTSARSAAGADVYGAPIDEIASVTPETFAPASPQPEDYSVQTGDTLSAIAQKRGVNLQQLIKSNPAITNPNLIQPGQSIKIPTPSTPTEQGFRAALDSGLPAPTSGGEAQSFIQQFTPAEKVDSPLNTLIQTDPMLEEIIKLNQEYMSPKNQRESLTETYKSLVESSGIEALDTELMNMKNVIEGTEDDIRNEVTKAGGFATDSQVLALTNSRNKQLIKNYNNLLETRNSKEAYINTLIGLEKEDRAQADAQFDRQINFQFQILNYRDKMLDNARSTYNKIVDKVGYNGLLQMAGGDPYYQNMIETTLGLGTGGLAQLAAQPDLERELKIEQLETERLQQQKLVKDINGTPTEKFTPYQQERDTRILGQITNLFDRVSPATVGLASLTKYIPGTVARDFAADLQSLTGNIFASELQAMRADSKTGGAIGNASDAEGEKLQNALAGLDQGQSVGSFKKNLVKATEAVVRYHQAKGDPSYDGVVVDDEPTSPTYGQLIKIVK